MQASAHSQAAGLQRKPLSRAQARNASRPPRKSQQHRPFSGSNERANTITKAAAAEVTGKVVDVELLDASTQSYSVVVDLGDGQQGVGTVSEMALKAGDSVTAKLGEAVNGLAALSILPASSEAADADSSEEDSGSLAAAFAKLQAAQAATQEALPGFEGVEAVPSTARVTDELVRYLDAVPEGASIQVGDLLEGTVVLASTAGVVVDLGNGLSGLLRVTDAKVPAAKAAAATPAIIAEVKALIAAANSGDEAAIEAAAAALLARKDDLTAETTAMVAEASALCGATAQDSAALAPEADAAIKAVLTPAAYEQLSSTLAAVEGLSSDDEATVQAGIAALGPDSEGGNSSASVSVRDGEDAELDADQYAATEASPLEGYEALQLTDATEAYDAGDSISVFVKDLSMGYAFLTQFTAAEDRASSQAAAALFVEEDMPEVAEELAEKAFTAAAEGGLQLRAPVSEGDLAAAQLEALEAALAAALTPEQKARLDTIRDKALNDATLSFSDEAFLATLAGPLASSPAVLDIVGRPEPSVDMEAITASDDSLDAKLAALAGDEGAASIKAMANALAASDSMEGLDAAEVQRVMSLSSEALQAEIAALLEGEDLEGVEAGEEIDIFADLKALEAAAGSSLEEQFKALLGDDVDTVVVPDYAMDAQDDSALVDIDLEDFGEEAEGEDVAALVADAQRAATADEDSVDGAKFSAWDDAQAYATVDDSFVDGTDAEIRALLADNLDEETLAGINALERMTSLLAAEDAQAPALAASTAADLIEIPGASVPAAVAAPAAVPPTAAEAAPAAAPTPAAEAAPVAVALPAAEGPPAAEAAPAAKAGPSAKAVKELRDKTGAGMMDCKKALTECGGDADEATEYLKQKGLLSAGKKTGRTAAEGLIQLYVHPDARFGILMEVNCETDFVAGNAKFYELVSDLCTQLLPDPTIRFVSVEDVPEDILAKEREIEAGKDDLASKPEAIRAKMVEGRVQKNLKEQSLLEQKFWKDDTKTVAEVLKEAINTLGENIKVRRFQRITLGEGIKKAEANLADEVAAASQAQPKAPKAPEPKVEVATAAPEVAKPAAVVQVSAKFVKELRDQTGAGMMDCKRALQECGGDAALATEWLRKKGFAGAAKKAGRTAAEGLIVGYLHPDCRFGVLVEANCETDFVAGNSKFYEFAQSIAVSIASNKEIQHVCVEDIPASVLAAERALALQASDLEGKPEDIKAKIVEGRVAKAAENMSLMNQPFVYDPEKTVGDVVKETITTLGENIKIRRFVRFDLGSGIEKKAADLAAEVAAMTGA